MSKFHNSIRKLVDSNYGDEDVYNMDDIIIHNTDVVLKNNKMQYLLFDFEKEVSPGKYERVFKAIKMIKLVRIPKKELTLSNFLNMQFGIVTGWNMNQLNFLQIFANITKPYKKGLIFAYGVQGVSGESIAEAKESADIQMAALEKGLTGTYRTLEYDDLDAEDARWIFKKMDEMQHMLVVRGIPEPKISQGRAATTIFTQSDVKDAEEQSEEFLIGMDEYEYLLVLTATTVSPETISKWTETALKEQTYWASLKQGQKSHSFSLSIPMVYGANMGATEGWNSGQSQNFGENYSTSQTHTLGNSESWSEGTSQTFSEGTNFGNNQGISSNSSFGESLGRGTSNGIGQSTTSSEGTSTGTSSSTSQSISDGTSNSSSHSTGISNSTSNSTSESYGESQGTSIGTGTSQGTSHSNGGNSGWSNSTNKGWSTGTSNGSSSSNSYSSSASSSTGWSGNGGFNVGIISGGGGANGSTGTSNGMSAGQGTSSGSSTGQSGGSSHGTSGGTSWSDGTSSSTSFSQGISQGTSHSSSSGTSTSSGTSEGFSTSSGNSHSTSSGLSQGISSSNSSSLSQGTSLSSGTSTSYGQSSSAGVGSSLGSSQGWSQSMSYGSSQGHSVGVSESNSYGTSQGVSTGRGTSTGISSSTNRGVSGSMGLGPSISFGKTFAWEDREATRLVDMLQFSLQRFIAAGNNVGMWFTDCYIVTESREASAAATTLAMSSWHSQNAMISPLQVYEPSDLEKEYLLKHMSIFSPSVKKEGIPGQFESYKYSTLLLSNELAAMSHLPRVNVGGIQASIDDPIVLTIPANRQNGEIFLGYVADVEKYSKVHKYKSGFKYCIFGSELHHAYFSGASRSGKTVAAKRAVAETYNNVRRGEKGREKRMRFVVMDPKQDWRALSKVVPPEKFRFYSLADPKFHPIKMNLMKIPKGVYAERYVDTLKEIFIRSFGLGDRGFNILGQAMTDVYKTVGVFDEDVKLNEMDKLTGVYPATERSKHVTLEDVALRLREVQESSRGEKQDAIQRILDRMYSFENDTSITKSIFCNKGDDAMGIDDLLGEDEVIVLESFGMNMMVSSFIFGLLTSSIYQYAVANGGFVEPKDQYETVLVLEEANQILIGEDRDNLGGANPFETILDQSAGYGLFIWAITQKIADMPQSILANCGIKVIGRQDRPLDIDMSVVQIGKEGKITDRQWKNWFPDMPQGWFVVKSARNLDFKMNAPVHVLVEYLDAEAPSNEELDTILKMNSMKHIQNNK